MKTVVVMPGGFHPFHAGHYALYKSAVDAFPNADVYVAATNDQKARPFPFAIKEKLAKIAGVAPGHFVQVKSPFKAEEITSHYNPNEDVLIFVRSEKDRNEQPKPGGMKKDGTPSYFQPYTGKNLQPFSKHAYFAYLPTVEFGPGITSATQIRNAWPTLDDRRKTAMVMSLYPASQKNPKLAANIVKMMDIGMGAGESLAEHSRLKFAVVELTEGQIYSYYKKKYALYESDKFPQRMVTSIKHLKEEDSHIEIQHFISRVEQLDLRGDIKEGDSLAVLDFEVNFAWREIHGKGFTNDKIITKVSRSNAGINYVEFEDGDRYPRLTKATYGDKKRPMEYAAYFKDTKSAEHALTTLALIVPDSWEFDISEIQHGAGEVAEGWKSKVAAGALAGAAALGGGPAHAGFAGDLAGAVAGGFAKGLVGGAVGPSVFKKKNDADLAFAERITDPADKAKYLKAVKWIMHSRNMSLGDAAFIGANTVDEHRFNRLKKQMAEKYKDTATQWDESINEGADQSDILYHGGSAHVSKFRIPPYGVFFSPHKDWAENYGDVLTSVRINATKIYLAKSDNWNNPETFDAQVLDALFDRDYKTLAKCVAALQAEGYQAIQTQTDSEMVCVFPGTEIQVLPEQGLDEANPNQQQALYKPDGTTYRGEKMPTLKNPDDIYNDREAVNIDDMDDEPADEPNMDNSIKELLKSRMAELNPVERKILQLRYWHDMTLADIADRIELSTARVRKIEYKALRKLKKPSLDNSVDLLRQYVPESPESKPIVPFNQVKQYPLTALL